MIQRDLLELTLWRAPGFLVYGGPGLKKTLGIHTLPPPIKAWETEGGSGPLLPWVRTTRQYNESKERVVSQELREQAFGMISDKNMDFVREHTRIKPGPYIDLVTFDALDPAAYDILFQEITHFDVHKYNSAAVDSLHEFSKQIQSFSKRQKWGDGGQLEPMEVNIWQPVQERTGILLRKLKNYRDQGVVVYMTSSEQIDKDYVKDPRESKKPGEFPQEPYSVKGTVNMPGKMPNDIQHLIDVMFHAKPVNGEATWVSAQEPLPGGAAHWEAKDRFGRLKTSYHIPNFRKIFDQIYGEDIRAKIYASGAPLLQQ